MSERQFVNEEQIPEALNKASDELEYVIVKLKILYQHFDTIFLNTEDNTPLEARSHLLSESTEAAFKQLQAAVEAATYIKENTNANTK